MSDKMNNGPKLRLIPQMEKAAQVDTTEKKSPDHIPNNRLVCQLTALADALDRDVAAIMGF